MSQKNPKQGVKARVFNINFLITPPSNPSGQMLPAIQDFRVNIVSIFAYTVIKKLMKCREEKYFK
jgi:hypothetical protein